MNEGSDPILDACLDEVLGGLTPPDLSQRILYELSRRSSNGSANAKASPDEILPPVCTVQTARNSSESNGVNRKARRDYNALAWASVGLALGVIALISVTGILVQHRWAVESVAKQQPDPSLPITRNRETSPTSPAVMPELPTVVFDPPKVDQKSSLPSVPQVSPNNLTEAVPVSPANTPSPTNLVARTPVPTPLSDEEIVGQINSAIRSQWTANKLSVPSFISNQDWQRRVFQVVLGREPTEEESKKFAATPAKMVLQSRSELLVALTSSDGYVEQFAHRWSEILTDVYLSRDLLDGGTAANRVGMLHYFRRALLDRRPFDRVATELLTATGSGIPGDAAYNGAANFLLARTGGRLEHATADTARMFLGRNVGCQQCHADPRDERRSQQEFWELNTFFRQLVAARTADSPATKLSDADFLGEDQKDGRNAIVFYELPDGVLKGAFPAFPGQLDLPKSGMVAEVNRRELLAKCVAESREFRQATANRLWSAVMGQGLVPADDLQAGAPEYRELLNGLADQFAAHQFDPRRVITWAALSEPFSAPESDLLATAHFQRFQGQHQGQRVAVQESLLAASKSFGQLNTNAATTAKVDTKPKNIGKNGKVVLEPPTPSRSLISDGATPTARAPDPLVLRILADQKLSAKQKADHLFQFVLHRQPRQREMEIVEQLIQQSGEKPDAAWNAVWNALQ